MPASASLSVSHRMGGRVGHGAQEILLKVIAQGHRLIKSLRSNFRIMESSPRRTPYHHVHRLLCSNRAFLLKELQNSDRGQGRVSREFLRQQGRQKQGWCRGFQPLPSAAIANSKCSLTQMNTKLHNKGLFNLILCAYYIMSSFSQEKCQGMLRGTNII